MTTASNLYEALAFTHGAMSIRDMSASHWGNPLYVA